MEDDVWWSAGWRAQQGCDVLFVSAELRVPNITFLNFRRLHVQSQHNCGHIFRSDCCFLQSFVGLSGNNHWVITEPTICLYNAKWPLVYYARNMRLMFWYTKSYSPGGGAVRPWGYDESQALSSPSPACIRTTAALIKLDKQIKMRRRSNSLLTAGCLCESQTLCSAAIGRCTSLFAQISFIWPNKVALTVITCNILFLLPAVFTQTPTCRLLPQRVHLSECIHWCMCLCMDAYTACERVCVCVCVCVCPDLSLV